MKHTSNKGNQGSSQTATFGGRKVSITEPATPGVDDLLIQQEEDRAQYGEGMPGETITGGSS